MLVPTLIINGNLGVRRVYFEVVDPLIPHPDKFLQRNMAGNTYRPIGEINHKRGPL